MKKSAFLSVSLLMLSVFAGQMDRVFVNSQKAISFLLYDGATSLSWYADYLGDLLSFSLFMLCIITVMKPIYVHFERLQDTVHHRLYVFTRLWYRLFNVIFIISVIDVFHFILAARQSEIIFLSQNILFLLLTIGLTYKAYR
jgi:hypothetical protein